MPTIAQRQKEALGKEWLTVEQFALLVQYQPKSIYRLIAKQIIRIRRIGPRTIRIHRSLARSVRDRHPHADQTLAL